MRRRFILALSVCILCVILLAACSGGDTAATEDGVLTEVTDSVGTVTGYERRYHNDHGDVTRLDVYDAEQEYDHYVIYEYDDAYRLVKETSYKANGIGDFYDTYTYDDDGTLVEKVHYTAYDGAQRILYSADGTETERFFYDTGDVLYRHEVMNDGEWTKVAVEATEALTK